MVRETVQLCRKFARALLPFRIGRLGGNDLKLDNLYISRQHIEITREGTTYQLRDLSSTSGTFVNDHAAGIFGAGWG